MRFLKNAVRRKIRVLKTFDRESHATGEMMGWIAGDEETAYVDLKTMKAEINWG